jgi:hypothetical protein
VWREFGQPDYVIEQLVAQVQRDLDLAYASLGLNLSVRQREALRPDAQVQHG